MLSKKDFRVVEKWQQLQALLLGVDKTILAKIDYSIAIFEFEAAVELVAKITE